MNYTFILLIIIAPFFYLDGQVSDPGIFYPIHLGDQWHYRDMNQDEPVPDYTRTVIGDTVDSLGNMWYLVGGTINHGYERVSDSFEVLKKNRLWHDDQLYYKLDADSGSWWIVNDGGRYGFVDDVYDSYYFEVPLQVKKIDYYCCFEDSIFGDDLYLYTDFLGTGIGKIESWWAPYGGEYLIGAIVDSNRYGTFLDIERFGNNNLTAMDINLNKNYPNPFNPVTTVCFELPERTDIRLTIYDLRGREVAVLTDKVQGPGICEVQWEATNVSSGMYFYQIRAGDFVQTRKMVLLK